MEEEIVAKTPLSCASSEETQEAAEAPSGKESADREQPGKGSERLKKQNGSGKGSGKKKPAGKSKKNPQKSTKQMLLGLLIKIGAIALAVWLLFTFVLGVIIHYGNNMHPMVRDGDLVFSFRLQKPYINAAVLYTHDGKTTVGRVIAMEGSTIDIADNGVFTVNNNVPSEEIFYPTYPADGSEIQYPYTVPAGKVFILNDFREDTNDSRSFGAVDVGDLKGTLLLTIRRRGF